MKAILITLLMICSIGYSKNNWPLPPSERSHPGSSQYDYTLYKDQFKTSGRTIDFFAPAEVKDAGHKVPLIIFGHGQAISLEGYKDTFEHLAKKGTAVAFVEYDKGFFDQDWVRMAQDFKSLGAAAINKYSAYVDPNLVIYAGHSKGGYVALMAAGLESPQVKSMVLFSPAGFDSKLIKTIPAEVPVTVIWGEEDNIVKESLVKEIYEKLSVNRKQYIEVKSYNELNPKLEADHFYILNKHFFFGGRDGITPFHYFGVWKWLLGASEDLSQNQNVTNTYLYGADAPTSGIDSVSHAVTRNF